MNHSSSHDVIVVGLGGFGSALLSELARKGMRVLGLERHSLVHTRGSSHGFTRIFRLAIYEKPFYTPWALAALEGWHAAEQRTGRKFFLQCGSVDLAPAAHPIIEQAKSAAEAHAIDYDLLAADELERRFPGMHIPRDYVGVYQPGAGLVLPELSVQTHLEEALQYGATIKAHEPLLSWEAGDAGVTVRTENGSYHAAQVVFTTGAYTAGLFPGQLPISPDRAVLGWFQPAREAARFLPENFPCWTLEDAELGHYYGLPIYGYPGFKIGWMGTRGACDPISGASAPDDDDVARLRLPIAKYFPEANGDVLALYTCLFENTPDRNPIIDQWPENPRVHIAAGFSGHGFKYVPAVVGTLSAQLSGDSLSSGLDKSPFAFGRFQTLNNLTHT